jgi:hypothetical protein
MTDRITKVSSKVMNDLYEDYFEEYDYRESEAIRAAFAGSEQYRDYQKHEARHGSQNQPEGDV